MGSWCGRQKNDEPLESTLPIKDHVRQSPDAERATQQSQQQVDRHSTRQSDAQRTRPDQRPRESESKTRPLVSIGPALAVSLGTVNSSVAYWSSVGGAAVVVDGGGSPLIKSCLRIDSQTGKASQVGVAALKKSTAARSKELVLWPKRGNVERNSIAEFLMYIVNLPPQFSSRPGKIDIHTQQGALLFCIPSRPEKCVTLGKCDQCSQTSCTCARDGLVHWKESLAGAASSLGLSAQFISDPVSAMLHAMCYDFKLAGRYFKKYLVIVAGAGYVSWGVVSRVRSDGLKVRNVRSTPFGTYDMTLWLEKKIWESVAPESEFRALHGKGDKAQYYMNCESLVNKLLDFEDVEFGDVKFTDTMTNVTGVDEFQESKLNFSYTKFRRAWDAKMEAVFGHIAQSCGNLEFTHVLCCGQVSTTKYYQHWIAQSLGKPIEVVPEPTGGCALGAAYAIQISNQNLMQDNLFLGV